MGRFGCFLLGILFVVRCAAADLGFWSDLQSPLSLDQRDLVVQEALTTQHWNELAESVVTPLAAQASSFAPDQPAWRDRLHLAQMFLWLNKPESKYALRLYQKYRRDPDATAEGEDRLAEMMLNPAFLEKADVLFGGASHRPKDQKLAQRLKPETLTALLHNTALVNILSATVTDDDYLPGVFQVLGDLQEHAGAKLETYPALAVALAVVYDIATPQYWPHPQVDHAKVPLHWGNWNDLFDYFVGEDENQKLLVDPKTLRADILKYMVDVPIEISELIWARDHVRKSRSSFNEVFGMVKYDMKRYDTKDLIWLGDAYTLENILKTNGICVDQAYFAFLSGKARGLPTIYFSGQGRDGGHAWFGYLKGEDKWDMEAGRYEGQQYVTGVARDPQNWQIITDHQLAFITNHITNTEDYQRSNALLQLATLPVTMDPKTRLDLLRQAKTTCPQHLGVWRALASQLQKEEDKSELKPHYEAMLEQFKGDADIRTEIQKSLLAVAQASSDVESIASLKKDIATPGRNRSDLGIKAAAAQLQEKLAALDYDNAVQDYKSSIRKFADDGGGNLLYGLIRPFVLKLHQEGQDERAKNCLLFAEENLQFAPNSMVAGEFDKVHATLGMPKKYTAGLK